MVVLTSQQNYRQTVINCNMFYSKLYLFSLYRCYFDEELFTRTGSGGHCLDCQRNTAGRWFVVYFITNFWLCILLFSREKKSKIMTLAPPPGPHCERCKEEFYRDPETNECTPCHCNQIGSTHLQCDELGRCPCKQGVGGDKCDRFVRWNMRQVPLNKG